MLLLRHNSSLPDLDASSFRHRSSSYPSYNTIPSKQFTSSPSEEILSNYVHTTPPSQPPLSMYSSPQDQRDNSLVDPWLPTPASAGVSQPADSSLPRSTYSPPHTTNVPLDDSARHARFLHTPSSSSSARQSFSSHQPPVSISRHLSEPNIRAVAAPSGHNYPLPTVTEQRYQQQHERRQRQSFQHGVLPSPSSATFSIDHRPSTAGSATSSGWERQDVRAESLHEVATTQGRHTSLVVILVDLLNELPSFRFTSDHVRVSPGLAIPPHVFQSLQ